MIQTFGQKWYRFGKRFQDKVLSVAHSPYYMVYMYTICRKIFVTKKVRESLPKWGGRNNHDKSIREGGSDTLRNTITWLLCLCGSSDL